MLASFTSNPRVPCPPGQVLKRLLGRLMSGCALLLCVGFSGAALADDFDELIRRLGNDNWEERDAAERAIKKIALTKAQFARLAEAANTSGDAEIRFRASEIVKAKIREVAPSIDKIADLVEVRQGDRTLEVQVEGTTSYFDFRFDSLYARSPAQRPALNGIVSLVDAAGSALMRGDPREASRQLQALETYLRAMTDAEWGAFFDARLERASREDAIAKVRETVSHMASRDMDRSREARAEAANMVSNVAGINASLGEGMREISECAKAIDGSVAEAVRALQFEDIATQALGGVHVHLDRLTAINREAVALQELLQKNGGAVNSEVIATLQRFGSRVQEMRGEWERPPHKPVTQHDMGAGSVELF